MKRAIRLALAVAVVGLLAGCSKNLPWMEDDVAEAKVPVNDIPQVQADTVIIATDGSTVDASTSGTAAQ